MPTLDPIPAPPSPSRRRRLAVGGAVAGLLALHVGLAVHSLLRENPTVDEVAHLPSGVSYWQKGTFKLYHHNPPLVKLAAALPVVLSRPITAPLYEHDSWAAESQATFAERFAFENADRYLDLFARGRLVMPMFAAVGGLAVFLWSRRLYGDWGGLLSLTLWCLCPNVLAHGRLVTTDVASASFAVLATYLFVRYLDRPTWGRAAAAGVVLGLAELTKFSLVLLYGFWPTLALVRFALTPRAAGRPRRSGVILGQGAAIVALSVLVIDLGYGFEGVGQRLGRFEFGSRTLTVPRPAAMLSPTSKNPLLDMAWRHRVNRFRGTALADLPVPLPRHYVLGFDEQKIEAEGLPMFWSDPTLPPDDDAVGGYSVYLNGEMRRSGWWYYYLATLAYKVPEGTWLVVGLGGILLVAVRRSRAAWADELAVLALPVVVLGAISLLTDICLGLRYILPVFPFAFVATGKVAPWVASLTLRRRRAMIVVVGAAVASNGLAVASIHPHYLAYFNRMAGGPDRGSEHLIDSNLDWGQDLITLGRWLRANRPGERVGLAYFGQINPSLLTKAGDPARFDWFLPPADGLVEPMMRNTARLVRPARRLTPGLYAVSASLVRGLPWRLYDPASLVPPHSVGWQASWRMEAEPGHPNRSPYGYFAEFTPVARVGHSIFVYDLTPVDVARWTAARNGPRLGE